MKRTGYALVFALVIVLVLAGTAMGAQKKPTTVAELALYQGADWQQILEEGAKKEGKLVFYTSGILKQAVRPVVDAFEKKYPYIKVEIWRASSSKIMPRVLEEYKAGRHLFDALESTQATHLSLREAGMVQPFSSPNLTHIEEGALVKAPGGGVFSAAFRGSGIGVGYHTKLITEDQLPKTYEDLLDPKWKGKMAIAGSSTGMWWIGTMLETYGEDFVKRIAKQDFDIHVVSARAIVDMVISGEYVCSPTVYDSHVINSKNKGAPVNWVPLEPVHLNVGQIALSKHASHPHAALLFIDFELSRKSAEIHKTAGYNPFHKDVSAAKTYKKFFGATTLAQVERWNNLFNRLFLKK